MELDISQEWCGLRYGSETHKSEEVIEMFHMMAAVTELAEALKEAISLSANCQRIVQLTHCCLLMF